MIKDSKFLSTLFIFFFLSLNLQAQSNQGYTIEEALLAFAERQELNIIFKADYFDQTIVLDKIPNGSQENVLSEILRGQEIEISIQGNLITLRKYKRIFGYVTDQSSGEPLIYASIYDSESGTGSTSNEYGFYSLRTDYLSKQVEVSYVGYATRLVPVKESGHYSIKLSNDVNLEEIVVNANNQGSVNNYNLIDKGDIIYKKDIENTISVGGEADVYQSLLKETGVVSGPDGFGGIHIRGGSNDQNLVLFDGVPVFNAGHALGLFSIFNPYAINKSVLSRDFIPAKYDGRLSSVLHIHTKEGNMNSFNGQLGTSSVASQLSLEGPIAQNKSSFFINVRRSHIDPFFKSWTKAEKKKNFALGESNFYFYDITAKLNVKFSNKDRIYFSHYRGGDQYNDATFLSEEYQDGYLDLDNAFKVNWGNEISSFRWNHLFSDRAFGNFQLSKSTYNYNSDYYYYLADYYSISDSLYEELYFTDFSNDINEYGIKYDLDFILKEDRHLSVGASYTLTNFEPGAVSVNQEIWEGSIDYEDIGTFTEDRYEANKFSGKLGSIYTSYKQKLLSNLSLALGIRYNHFSSDDGFVNENFRFNEFSPRGIISYELGRNKSIFFSYNKTFQPLHVLSTADTGFPNELWIPAVEGVAPSSADQYVLGLKYAIDERTIFNVRYFEKRQRNIVQYASGASLPTLYEISSDCLCEDAITGIAKIRGIEFQGRFKIKNQSLQLSYSWLKAQRKFDEIENGEWYDYRYDRNHSFNLFYSKKLSKRFSLFADWSFASGMAQTLFVSPYQIQISDNLSSTDLDTRSAINAHRLEPNHKLNINFSFFHKTGRWDHRFNLGIHNLYNRQNTYFEYLIEDPDFPEDDGLEKKNGLPLLPNISYQVSF